jgi:hypothetical protein
MGKHRQALTGRRRCASIHVTLNTLVCGPSDPSCNAVEPSANFFEKPVDVRVDKQATFGVDLLQVLFPCHWDAQPKDYCTDLCGLDLFGLNVVALSVDDVCPEKWIILRRTVDQFLPVRRRNTVQRWRHKVRMIARPLQHR